MSQKGCSISVNFAFLKRRDLCAKITFFQFTLYKFADCRIEGAAPCLLEGRRNNECGKLVFINTERDPFSIKLKRKGYLIKFIIFNIGHLFLIWL
jgi:hypothetical protein